MESDLKMSGKKNKNKKDKERRYIERKDEGFDRDER